MTYDVPKLAAKEPGPIVRVASLMSDGVRSVMDQIEPYTQYWNDRNARDIEGDGPLLIAIGDSTALGIGASHPSLSFVGQLAYALSLRDRIQWRVICLAQSGAKLEDGLNRQVPAMKSLPSPDLAVCCIGSNDLAWSVNTKQSKVDLLRVVSALGPESIFCPAAGGSPKARAINRAARDAALARGLSYVNVWHWAGAGSIKKLAADRFHPNDAGYAAMCAALARYLGAPEPNMSAIDAALHPLT